MKKGFKVHTVSESKPIGVNYGFVHKANGITTYNIDLKQKHCEILCFFGYNKVWLKCGDLQSIFEFDFSESNIILAEVNRYTLVVRVIPKIKEPSKWNQIEKKNTKTITLGDGKTKSKVTSFEIVGNAISFG